MSVMLLWSCMVVRTVDSVPLRVVSQQLERVIVRPCRVCALCI